MLSVCLVLASSGPALAKNGSDDGGGDDHGGPGRGGDDNGGEDNSGRDSSGSGRESSGRSLSQDEVLDGVRSGKIISLKQALEIVSNKVEGRVIDIGLTSRMGRAQYRVKVRRDDGAITTLRLDARTGRFVGFWGL